RAEKRPATEVAGVLVSVEGRKLKLTPNNSQDAVTRDVPESAEVTLDGKSARLSELAEYADIVIVKRGGAVVAVRAEKPREDRGTVVGVVGKKLTMTNDRQEAVTLDVPDTA